MYANMISHHTSRSEQRLFKKGFLITCPTNAMMVCFMNVKTTLSAKRIDGCRIHVEINKDCENFMQSGNISFKINLKL